jgi:single-stranded-DNA-specific exonuclease
MKHQWLDPTPVSVPDPLREAVGGHPLVAETLARRGITRPAEVCAFLDPAAYTPTPAAALPDVARAAARLAEAIRHGERICVWGDFDVDGQTATTLLVSTLRAMGADVDYHIPIRATESHGVNLPHLKAVIAEGTRLLLTCDTGIKAHEAVAYANAQGVDVIITDHHELPTTLPDALAVVNPHRLPDDHPLATLPGVGVAYKLAEALLSSPSEESISEAVRRESLTEAKDTTALLDLVALGIVVDVATLAGDTRYLLQRGLEVLRHTERLGLQALFKLANINPAQLNETTIGFGIGPRLNSLGRLADANLSVEFLTTRDPGRAQILAARLEGLNMERRRMTEAVLKAAQGQIEDHPELLEYGALVLAHPQWPAGVIGLVASRLVERYHKPTVLIATPPDKPGHASARSIEGVDITAAIATVTDLLLRFGGHTMAAGFAIEPSHIPLFRKRLSQAVRAQMGKEAVRPPLQIDAYLPLEALTLDLVDDLERLAPFGPGNPALTLATRDLHIAAQRTLGRGEKHLRVTVEDTAGNTQNIHWWQWRGASLPQGRFDLAYTVRDHTYQGQRTLQATWVEARDSTSTAGHLTEAKTSPFTEDLLTEVQRVEVVDYRRDPRPLARLRHILDTDENVQVWREGATTEEAPGRGRDDLSPSPALAVWTLPPSPTVWRTVIERVAPTTLYLFGIDPGLDTPQAFLERLGGGVKHALREADRESHGINVRGINIRLADLAAVTAQREITVHKGLLWLAAKGYIIVLEETNDGICLAPRGHITKAAPGDREGELDVAVIAADLKALLDETAAYRRYFLRVEKDRILP